VIQFVLLFCFGFLSAVLLALLVAPAFRRRAVRLTERRIRATVPLTMNEIQAEKDGLRAEFAMSSRRLEMKVKSLQERVAAQMVEIERGRQEQGRIGEERDQARREAAEREAKIGELEAALQARGEELQALSARFEESAARMAGKDAEISRLDLAATDASLEVSSRQIELAAREAEVAKLKDDAARLKEQRRQGEEKLREITLDNRSGREALKTERGRAGDLERRLEKALAALADREETLGRRQRELARLRERGGKTAGQEKAPELPEATEPRSKDISAATASAGLPTDGEAPASPPAAQQEALARLATERKRLEERLTTLTRENKRLRTASLVSPEPAPALPREIGPGEASLREKISTLAAEMVAMTALVEGPDSAIDRALAMPEASGEGPPSLAERVRALREAARRE
jgi:predicted  nucleic acid-binding Zn-ribbon protein